MVLPPTSKTPQPQAHAQLMLGAIIPPNTDKTVIFLAFKIFIINQLKS